VPSSGPGEQFIDSLIEMDFFSISYAVLWTVVLVEGVALLLVLRSVGTIFLNTREGISRDGLSIGSMAPDIDATDAGGVPRSFREFRGRWLVLVFASPTCTICLKLVPDLRALRSALGSEAEILVALRADGEEVASAYERATGEAAPVFAIGTKAGTEKYKVRVSPFVNVVDPQGILRAKGLVNTVENVEHLLFEAGVRHPRVMAHAQDSPAEHQHG